MSEILQRWCCAGANGKVFRRIYLLEPTGDAEEPFRVLRMVNHTQQDIVNVLRPLGVLGLLSESDMPEDPAAVDLDELDIPSLGSVDLQDGGEYVTIFLRPSLNIQVGTYSHTL